MKFKALTTAVAVLSLSTAAVAQVTATPEFTADAFRAHVTFLADDLLEGREVGTRGYDIAANYVATQLSGLGIQPAVNGGWFQHVDFLTHKLADAPGGVTIGGRLFPHGSDAVVQSNPMAGPTSIEAPAVFVGYGLNAPSLGFNDYSGLDVRGKVVVALSGVPKGTPSDVGAHLGSDKIRMAMDAGAIGFVTVPTRERTASYPWPRVLSASKSTSYTWLRPGGEPFSDAPKVAHRATLNTPAAEALFQGAPATLASILAEADKAGGRPKGFALNRQVKIERRVTSEKLRGANVVGVLPGSDPALANEYVLMMAHLDHEGMDPSLPGDKIFNGAMDNSTGIATLLETAKAMAKSGKRPRRPILFAAVTAEEKGLLGSQYLAKYPVLKSGKVVGVVNLDMPILTYDFSDVIAFGAEHSTLGPIVERAGAQMNVKLAQDPLPEERLFVRSDHYRFVQEGVPSVFLMTGFSNGGEAQFRGFLKDNYHKVSDDLRLPINWNAGAKFARLNYLIAREIADADQAPRWYQDSFFGTTFAPGQGKAARR